MAEPVSLSLAIAGIPAIFTSCVDFFQYVRLGKRFGKDYGVSLAKLEAAQVRLTRWGEPIGLLDNKVDIKGPYNDADIRQAYDWLTQIQAAFEEANDTSTKYSDKQQKNGKHRDLELLDEDATLESGSSIKNLVISLKGVVKERQKNLSLPRKMAWALYGKDNFDALLEDIVTLINNLVELFPSIKPRLVELCKQEVGDLEKGSVLELAELLKNNYENLNNTDDEILSKVISDHVKAHSLEFSNVNIDGDGINRFGDEYGYSSGVRPGNLKVDGMHIKGSGFTHAGHVFNGK